jgi:hypothetical protein
MNDESLYKKFQKANFELFYYLCYDYNEGKISRIIYDFINFLQLLSINMNLKVNN